MQKSRYNVETLSDAGERLLYNTANGAFAVLSARAYEAYCQGGGAFVGELAKVGFLTELSPEQELARQQEFFDAQRRRHDVLTLSFVPTYACNYRCPYCYEAGHNKVKGFMDERVMDAVCAFIAARHADHAFERLEIQWYGGEPSLCLDVVEQLSQRMISWCESAGVAYNAMMLSNCYTIDEATAALLARCRVTFMYMTIDGPKEHHDVRRVAASGAPTYERTIEAARALRAQGIRLAATMNADKTIMPLFPEFAKKLWEEEGIELTTGQLNDYGHCYGTGAFCAPEFELYNHDEYARARYELLDKGRRSAAELREMLSPQTHFCTGQKDDYFVIDLLGDVYKCDGWVGDKSFVKFNLFDDESTWQLDVLSHDATRDAQCSQCEFLPICHGSCIWERTLAIPETGKMPCHPLKLTIADYLRDYRSCFGPAESDVRILARPLSEADIAAK